MTINSHLSTFAGLPVLPFAPGMELPADPAAVAWRLEIEEFDAPPEEFVALTEAFLAQVPPAEVRALVVGEWGSAYETSAPVELLASLAPRLTGLRAIFLADLVMEQCEISWINQGDITGLLTAWPGLEVLRVRGAQGLTLSPVTHSGLRELAFESGGLPAAVVRAVGDCELPALEHLEIWLGVPNYGGDATAEDVAPILTGERLPALRHLALCNAEIADAVAAAVVDAPVLARLSTLDLSKGILTDEGGESLLAGASALAHLRRLDLHHHFLTEPVRERLVAALPQVEIDLADPQQAEVYNDRTYRFTAVGE